MEYKNIVIGSSLQALLFSYYNDYPIIINSLRRPFRFDNLSMDVDFCGESIRNKSHLWFAVAFNLSLEGLSPFGPEVQALRINEDVISNVVEPGTNMKIKFEKCFVFDDDNLTVENEITEEPHDNYRVFDWMNVRRGTTHGIDYLGSEDDFVRHIYFYKSERIDGNHNKKDLVAVSFLRKEELDEFDNSETMAKFKIQKEMSAHGIIGAKSGLTHDGRQRKYNVKVEPDYRYVEPLGKRCYKDSERVKFMDLTAEEVILDYA